MNPPGAKAGCLHRGCGMWRARGTLPTTISNSGPQYVLMPAHGLGCPGAVTASQAGERRTWWVWARKLDGLARGHTDGS